MDVNGIKEAKKMVDNVAIISVINCISHRPNVSLMPGYYRQST